MTRIEEIKNRMLELDTQMSQLECGDELYLSFRDEWKTLRNELNTLEK